LVKVNPKKYFRFFKAPIEKGDPCSSGQFFKYEIFDQETFSPKFTLGNLHYLEN